MVLNVSTDDKVLPTTYGELKPPLGKHRLKVSSLISIIELRCMTVLVCTKLPLGLLTWFLVPKITFLVY